MPYMPFCGLARTFQVQQLPFPRQTLAEAAAVLLEVCLPSIRDPSQATSIAKSSHLPGESSSVTIALEAFRSNRLQVGIRAAIHLARSTARGNDEPSTHTFGVMFVRTWDCSTANIDNDLAAGTPRRDFFMRLKSSVQCVAARVHQWH
jgi:hypothetical protein